MTTFVFVLVFVLLGLGVLLVGLSGGPSGALQQLQTQSRGGRKTAVVLFAIAVIVLGAGIPFAVIKLVDNQNDIPKAGVTNLTAAEKHGRELFGQRCTQCHTLEAANSVAQVGPNLDDLRPPKSLVLDALKNGRARGNGAMAKDLVVGQDATDVANFVSAAVGQTGK